jgi:hypothetical protein
MTRSYAAGITIAADSFVDLQTHTRLSDGEWTPEDLIDHFLREGFATAAITDHDRVDTLVGTQHIARDRGFPLLVAAEMTTRWRDSAVDLLCFGFENDPSPLNALCERIYQAQTEVSRQVYQNLVLKGTIPRHDDAELAAILHSTTSRQPYQLFDLALSHFPKIEEEFSIMVEAGYRLCTNPTREVVEAVHQGGGVAVIAHPGRTDGYATFDADLLDQFRAEIPIDGIEVYYPRHTPEQIELYEAYARRHGWFISAGSDSHSPDKPPIRYPADRCAALLARLDIAVA